MRASFYAGDAAVFIRPEDSEVSAVQEILKLFGDASGLRTNIHKCVAFFVGCGALDTGHVMESFGGTLGTLPCKYLGLPLGLKKPSRAELQIILDKIASKLSVWRGKLMDRAARLILVNLVITSIAVYHLTAFPADTWFIKKVDNLRRGFLWNAEQEVSRGKCMINWKQVCSPHKYGGLGIKDIRCFGRALRLRWEWFSWDQIDRPWKGMPTPCDESDKELFASCTKISLGNGETASFWNDRWLRGHAPRWLAPYLYKLAHRKKLSVKEALTDGKWMQGLQHLTKECELDQLMLIWPMIQQVHLLVIPDTITWMLTADGTYSASSAYEFQFLARVNRIEIASVWSLRAEEKIKFFMWLLLQNRLWTADRLQKRDWEHEEKCCLCDQVIESAFHLFLDCPFARETWFLFENQEPRLSQSVTNPASILEWWQSMTMSCTGPNGKATLALAAYTLWNLWNERNRRIFQKVAILPQGVADRIREDVSEFSLAMRRYFPVLPLPFV